MNKFYLILSAVLFCYNLFAQQGVGINSDASNPDPSAMLHIKSANKGLLIPNIALTGSTDISTIPSPATSLLVYNTSTISDVVPGYYYFDGTSWKALVSASTTDGNGIYDGSGNLSGNTVVTGGANTLDFTTTATDGFSVDGTTFSVDGANDRVGIGTTTPGAPLDVNGPIWQTGTGQSVFIGEGAGANDDLSNNQNVFVGYQAG